MATVYRSILSYLSRPDESPRTRARSKGIGSILDMGPSSHPSTTEENGSKMAEGDAIFPFAEDESDAGGNSKECRSSDYGITEARDVGIWSFICSPNWETGPRICSRNAVSLRWCTEALGCESSEGTDGTIPGPEQEINGGVEEQEEEEEEEDDADDDDDDDEEEEEAAIYGSGTRWFPPPLSTISRPARLRSYKNDGRLVVRATPTPCRKCLRSFRHGGRLQMQFVNANIIADRDCNDDDDGNCYRAEDAEGSVGAEWSNWVQRSSLGASAQSLPNWFPVMSNRCSSHSLPRDSIPGLHPGATLRC